MKVWLWFYDQNNRHDDESSSILFGLILMAEAPGVQRQYCFVLMKATCCSCAVVLVSV